MSQLRVAVIGAGLMGSGIAAQITNAGYEVVLLDIVPPDLDKFGGDRSAFAKGAIEKLLKIDPVQRWLLVTPSILTRTHRRNL